MRGPKRTTRPTIEVNAAHPMIHCIIQQHFRKKNTKKRTYDNYDAMKDHGELELQYYRNEEAIGGADTVRRAMSDTAASRQAGRLRPSDADSDRPEGRPESARLRLQRVIHPHTTSHRVLRSERRKPQYTYETGCDVTPRL
jgi:hypothetical protein